MKIPDVVMVIRLESLARSLKRAVLRAARIIAPRVAMRGTEAKPGPLYRADR